MIVTDERPRLRRFHKLAFSGSLLVLSWLCMMAVHELGHVLGALVSGGQVQRVVLHPLSISRTDVSPNPHPGLVVWSGPLIGVLFPALFVFLVPRERTTLRIAVGFFAGFCLIVNGAYISLGSFERIGDCGEMLATGTPNWLLLAFGFVTIPLGLFTWHRLGPIADFINDRTVVSWRTVAITCGLLALVLALEFSLAFLVQQDRRGADSESPARPMASGDRSRQHDGVGVPVG